MERKLKGGFALLLSVTAASERPFRESVCRPERRAFRSGVVAKALNKSPSFRRWRAVPAQRNARLPVGERPMSAPVAER
jgi:hypothetical protein